MKRVKFFIEPQIQTEYEAERLEQRINDYINSLGGITLGDHPHGYLNIVYQINPNNNSSYSDLSVMVVSEDQLEGERSTPSEKA